MGFTRDWVTALNFALCIIALLLGYKNYKKNKDNLSCYIGIAFGLFAFSYTLNTLVSPTKILVIREVAYLVVIFALYKAGYKKQPIP